MSARFLVLPVLIAWGGSHAGLAEDAGTEKFAPEGHGISRYEQIWKRSPFIVETVAVVQSPGLASKYALVGLASSKSDSIAFLVDKTESDPLKTRIILSKKNPDTTRDLHLLSISQNKDIRDSTVTIKQGAEQADLKFDDTALNNSGMGVQPGQQAGAPAGTSPAVIPPPGTDSRLQAGFRQPGAQLTQPASTVQVPAQPVQGTVIQAPAPPNSGGNQQPPPTTTRRIIRPKPINVN